jgi:hypothetical protein
MSYQVKRWEHPSHYFGEVWPDYYSSGVGQSRDSSCLEESNFAMMLEALGGESETIIVVRESHWAVGWVEWIAIHESNRDALKIAMANCDRLNNYPVLNEDDLGEREQEAANEIWKNCYDWQERIKYIREHDNQFDFHDFRDLIACVRGEFFNGYASELIGE